MAYDNVLIFTNTSSKWNRSRQDSRVPRSLAPIKKDHLLRKSTVYTSTNNHLGWELGGTGVLGVGTGTGDLYMEMFYNEQTTL